MRLLGAGRTADVFALDDHRVLRHYRTDRDVTREAAAMAHVISHGFPAPAVHAAAGRDLVMERLKGPVLLDAVAAREHDAGAAGRVLADLHVRLHASRPGPGRRTSACCTSTCTRPTLSSPRVGRC